MALVSFGGFAVDPNDIRAVSVGELAMPSKMILTSGQELNVPREAAKQFVDSLDHSAAEKLRQVKAIVS